MIRVLAVDDHPLMRQGIASMLSGQSDIALVAEAATGREAIDCFAVQRPDVTLMDLQLPDIDGVSVIGRIVATHPQARIVVLTTYKRDAQALRALKAGARGYLLKSMLRKELLDAIRLVHAGQRYVPAEIALELGSHALDEELSQRELDILNQLCTGGTNKQIARALGLSEDTVKTHMKNLMAKLKATDRTQALTIALRRGIVSLP